MKIYFLRHGVADWLNWDKPDTERPLTTKGRKEMKRIGKFLRDLEPKICRIISSPLPRAWQTAEIANDYLDVPLKKEPALAKGFTLKKFRALVNQEKENLMLVGHEPDFSAVIRGLTGGDVKLAKAGIAVVELEDPNSHGRLLWLIPPKISGRKNA